MRARQATAAMMTVEDLAAALGIGRNKAYEAVQTGEVRAMRLGHRWLIPRAEVARLTGLGVAPADVPLKGAALPDTAA
jgi:excisionase family DNA binding protein